MSRNTRAEYKFGLLGVEYTVVMVVCFISAFITDTGWSSVLIHTLQNCSFLIILYSIYNRYIQYYNQEKVFQIITRPYIILIAISAIGAFSLFWLTKFGVSPYINYISDKYDLFADNTTKFGSQYYYPYFLSIIDPTSIDIRIPFFNENGAIDGLFHEPHCMTFMSFPAFFLMLYYAKKKYVKIAIWILLIFMMCLAGSTTNIASVFLCLIVFLLYTFKTSLSKTLSLLSVIGIIFFISVKNIDLTLFEFIFNKIESGSMTYSVSTIDFAISPRTILGTSFLNLGYLQSSSLARKMDVGYIQFVTNGLFLFLCCRSLFRLFMSKSRRDLFVMLACCYFFAHSAKVAMVTYSLSMLIFIIFLMEMSRFKPRNA